MHLCRIYIWYRFMLFLLGFTCMFVSLQSFLQHLIQETIWKLVKVRMSAAESFSKTWRYLPDGLIFSNFISILRQIFFLLLVCIFLPDFDTLAVVRWIPPILSWDHFISNMGTKVLLHIWIAYLLVFFFTSLKVTMENELCSPYWVTIAFL